MEKRNTKDLRPHLLNDEIYGDRADSDLVESIRKHGVINPILITHRAVIISGHRRWAAAQACGLDIVPVAYFESEDDLLAQEALIESNRQREKTNEQIGRENIHLTRIYREQSSRQGANQYADAPVQRTNAEIGREHMALSDNINGASVARATEASPSQRSAELLGVHRSTAAKASQVVRAVDELKATGQTKAAEELRQNLNRSVNGAYNQARSNGLIEVKSPRVEPARNTLTVAQWNEADAAQRADWLFAQHQERSTFNATNDNIEWAAWSWNPVTGCLHNCAYCYARDIAARFYTHLPDGERFAPVFYPSRLSAPSITKQPDLTQFDDPILQMAKRNVFVCSMADLFGKWVPSEWIDSVLQQAWDNPQWTFLFLTKFPIRMAEFKYPPNTWIGTTVDTQYAVERAEKAFRKVRESGYEGVAWLSCEPMLERLTFSSLEMFDWVVVGGSSESTQTPEFLPPFEWIAHLWQQAKACDLPVYMKTNLGITQRVREYPPKA